MKKKIAIMVLILVIAIVSILPIMVNAADATLNIKKDVTQVHKGETFSITLNVICEEGINGLITSFSYDEAKLELQKTEIVDTTKWINLGESPNIEIMSNSMENTTSADIVKLTFKVKDNAELGTAKVTISDIVVDSNAGTNSRKELGTQEAEVTIVEKTAGNGENPGENPGETPQGKTLTSIEIETEPTKKAYKVGEKFDKTGMKVVAKYSDGTSEEVTTYTIENGEKLEEKQTSVRVSYTEEEVTKTVEQKITVEKDTTESTNKMPYTGNLNIISIIAIIAVLGAICLIRYNKYKEI